ncbi:MAG: hypothetical protein AAGA17_18970 [Actinomycetota bacterium]
MSADAVGNRDPLPLSGQAVDAPEPLRTTRHGRAEAVNILSHAPWWRAGLQWAIFVLARRTEWVLERVLGRTAQPTRLKRLNFLYTARWVRLGSPNVLSAFPTAGLLPHRWEWPHRRWMLFVSNFNQGWPAYFRAFLDSIPTDVARIWRPSGAYPGHPDRGSRYDTINWTNDRLICSQHYYCRYPDLSANDVRMALRVAREVQAFRDVEPGTQGSQAELLHRLRVCLGDLHAEGSDPVEAIDVLGGALPTGEDAVFGFVSLLPVARGRSEELRGHLLRFSPEESPFGEVCGVHFARFAIIGREQPAGRDKTVRLRNEWLMFAVDYDGRFAPFDRNRRHFRRRWIGDLVERFPDQPDDRWIMGTFELCSRRGASRGGRVDHDVVEDMLAGGLTRRYGRFYDYPDATVPQIEAAAQTHRWAMARLEEGGGLRQGR